MFFLPYLISTVTNYHSSEVCLLISKYLVVFHCRQNASCFSIMIHLLKLLFVPKCDQIEENLNSLLNRAELISFNLRWNVCCRCLLGQFDWWYLLNTLFLWLDFVQTTCLLVILVYWSHLLPVHKGPSVMLHLVECFMELGTLCYVTKLMISINNQVV